mmetsp:Transcript_74410/g.210182  ORF Transcript_74410/g.210182 Transcript_74410/m.210182 type:complete len:445 (+) Transcript_74410:417-1751(+)
MRREAAAHGPRRAGGHRWAEALLQPHRGRARVQRGHQHPPAGRPLPGASRRPEVVVAVVESPVAGDAPPVQAGAEDEPLPRLVAPGEEGPDLAQHLPDAATLRPPVPDHAAGLRAAQGLSSLGRRSHTMPDRIVDLEALQSELRPGHQGFQFAPDPGRGAGARAQAWHHPAVHPQPALDRRLQVRPADLCRRPLVRPPEGVHQRRGPRPPSHREVLGRTGDPRLADHAPHELFGEQVVTGVRPEQGWHRRQQGERRVRGGAAALEVVAGGAPHPLRAARAQLRRDVRPHQGPRHQDADRRRGPHAGHVVQGARGGGPGMGRAGPGRRAPRELLRDVRLRRAGGRRAEAVAAGGQHLPVALLGLAAGQAHQDEVCCRHLHARRGPAAASAVAPDERERQAHLQRRHRHGEGRPGVRRLHTAPRRSGEARRQARGGGESRRRPRTF